MRFRQSLYQKYQQMLLYLIFGALTTLVSLISFWLLLKLMGPEQTLEINVFSWIISVTFAFFTNAKWVFNQDHFKLRNLVEFFMSRVATLIIEEAILLIFVYLLHFNAMLIKLIAQIVIIILNYVLSKYCVFN